MKDKLNEYSFFDFDHFRRNFCTHKGDINFHSMYPAKLDSINLSERFLDSYDGWICLEPMALCSFKHMRSQEHSIIFTSIQDFTAPTSHQMDEIILFMHDKKKVLITCNGGHGRTGTVLAIWMHLQEGDEINPIKRIRNLYCNRAVETIEQESFIYEYLNYPPPIPLLIEEEDELGFLFNTKKQKHQGGAYMDLF